MKGLLHRLAARAAGTALPIRSNARLPFGGIELPWADEAQDADGAQPAATLPLTIYTRPDAPSQRAEPESAGPALASSAEPSLRQRAEAPTTPLPRQAHTHRHQPVEPSETLLHAAAAAAPETPAGATRHVSLQTGDGSRVGARTPSPETSGTPIEWHHRKPEPQPEYRIDGSNRHAAMPPFAEPAPLMPPARVHTNTAMPGTVPQRIAQPDTAPAQAPDDAPEVHIHIGRIEVTAVRETPAPRPQLRERKASLSLDAYLDARNKA